MSEVIDQAVEESVISEDTIETPIESEQVQEGGELEVQAESQEELEGEVEQAIEEGASEEEIVKMVKQYQLKVNGKEYIKEVDVSDDEAITSILQREAAGQLAMQEAAELKKAYEQELVRLKQDPIKFLEDLGIDSLDVSEQRIQEEIKRQQKTPEELERESVQKELIEAREKAAKLEKQIEERESAQLYEQESIKLKDEIKTALDAHTTLHASPRITRRVAETMEWAMDNGFESVTAEEVLPTVEAQMTKELNEMFSDFDEKALERYIGKGNLDKMRQKRVSEAAKKPASIAELKKESAPKLDKKEEVKKKKRLEDFMRSRY